MNSNSNTTSLRADGGGNHNPFKKFGRLKPPLAEPEEEDDDVYSNEDFEHPTNRRRDSELNINE